MSDAVTKIANIYEPTPFNQYLSVEIATTNKYLQSGMLTADDGLLANMAAGGRIFESPFWNPIGVAEPNVSTDDNTSSADTKNVTASYQKIVRHNVNDSWSVMNLTKNVTGTTGGDPLQHIASQVAKRWNTDINYRVAKSLQGIILDNIDNDSGDMVNDVSLETTVGQTAANLFSGEAFIDALATMGDFDQQLGTMVVHSVVYATMRKLNLIDFIPDSEGVINFPTYMGLRVLVDDAAPVIAGTTSGYRYMTMIAAPGTIGFADYPDATPSEMLSKPDTGNGAGEMRLYSRRQFAIAPYGFSWEQSAGTATSYANLILPASWDREYSARKNAKIACLITNG